MQRRMDAVLIDSAATLNALQQYQILDSEAEASFDDIARLAAQICNTPIAAITFIDHKRQWFKSKIGLEFSDLPLDVGFCPSCVRRREVLVISDTLQDEQWATNSSVVSPPYVRAYVGVPLITPTEAAIGTLCVIDVVPRSFTPEQIKSLEALSKQIVVQLELKRHLRVLAAANAKQQQVEEALRESEKRFRAMANSAPVLLWIADVDALCTFFNQSWLDFTGRTLEQESGNGWTEGIHPADLQQFLETYLSAFHGRQSFQIEHRLRRADGEYRWVLNSGAPRLTPSGNFVGCIGSCTDITDRVRVENERKQAKERLLRQSLSTRLFSEVALKIRQSLDLKEILQTTVTEIQKLLQADRVLIFQSWADGSGKVVQESVVPGYSVVLGQDIVDPCFQQDYRERYEGGRISAIVDIESANIHSCHVALLRRFQVRANLVVPILCRDSLWGLLIAHQCSGARQWSEFETELLQQLANQIGIAISQGQLLEQALRQQQELTRSNAELEQFAYVASHDLQEPLRMVTSYLQLLERRYKNQLDTDADEFINYAVSGAAQMRTLIHDLLRLSRISTQSQPFEQVESEVALKRAIANLQLLIQQSGAVVVYDDLPEVIADVTQLTQVFQNLIGNAIKFRHEEPPKIWISAKKQESKEEPPEPLNHSHSSVPLFHSPAASKWLFSVRDNGIGIESQYCDRIFIIFQRLHSRTQYPGTGIGLAICKKIVERHGGQIWVESKKGQGSTFYFTLLDREGRSP